MKKEKYLQMKMKKARNIGKIKIIIWIKKTKQELRKEKKKRTLKKY